MSLNKEISSSGKWEDLRKKLNLSKEEEKEIQQEMAVIQAKIDERKIIALQFTAGN